MFLFNKFNHDLANWIGLELDMPVSWYIICKQQGYQRPCNRSYLSSKQNIRLTQKNCNRLLQSRIKSFDSMIGVQSFERVRAPLIPWKFFDTTFFLQSWPIIFVLFLISLQAIVMHKGRMGRREMFDDVCRETADQNWRNCVRYLLKYFFHKFGLEVRLVFYE